MPTKLDQVMAELQSASLEIKELLRQTKSRKPSLPLFQTNCLARRPLPPQPNQLLSLHKSGTLSLIGVNPSRPRPRIRLARF